MESFFKFFAERHTLAYMITFTAILLGISTLFFIKRDIFPEVDFGEMVITTAYPGASPEDVELKVTNKIEDELKSVTGIKRYTSWSSENFSFIHVVIDSDERDEKKVVREIRDAASRVKDLPDEVDDLPLVTELNTSVLQIIEVGLTGDLPYKALRELARQFEKKLENIPGVSHVDRYGYRDREIRVEVDPEKMIKPEVSLTDIVRAVSARNIRATGGSFESYTSEKNIVTLAQFRKPDEVGEVIVKTTFDGIPTRVKDIAVVRDDFEEEKVISRINGQSAISFIAHKNSSADIIRTVDAIKKLIEKEQRYLPEGVSLIISNDQSAYVKKRLNIVRNNGLIGLALVLIVLSIFLRPRIAFWVALGVPIALLGVIFLLPIFNSFLDTVTLTAMVLVIGIIVDDAIIISENIYQRFEKGDSPLEAAVNGVKEVFLPVVTTILTTFAAFAPLFFMPGILGKFVYVIPLVITLALLISLIESTLALPAHLAAGLKKRSSSRVAEMGHFFERLRQAFRGWVYAFLKFRYVLVIVFMGVLGGSITYAIKYMDFVLFPSSTAERFAIFLQMPTGTSLHATSKKITEVENILTQMGDDELESYMTRVGTFGDDVVKTESENYAAIYVNLTPFAERHRTADEIVENMRSHTKGIKDIRKLHYQIDSGGPPVGRPIMVRVVGANDAMRKRLADDVESFLKNTPGTKDIDRNDKEGKQQIELKLNYDRLARVGLTVADVARNVRIAYDGEVVTSVRYGDEDVDFRVIFKESVRRNPDYLYQLHLPNKTGRLTALKSLATLENGPGPSNFNHYKGERTIVVSGDVYKDITTPIKVAETVEEQFNLPQDYPGMRLVIGGEAEESAKSFNELLVILGIAALAIYALLILLFNSFWQPFLVMLAVPFGLTGVIFAFAVHGEVLGFLAMTGIIGLAGVVVNDSLVLVNHLNELCKCDPQRPLEDIVAEGTANRLRAILLTTFSTVAGLLPLAYGIGGSDPYMGPMALALGYGLLFATPLTLILMPCLYMISADVNRWVANTCGCLKQSFSFIKRKDR